MKKYILISLLLLPGCACTNNYLPPIQTRPVPTIQQTLAKTQIQASQLNQLVSGIMGPNQVSGALLTFQNYNRNVNAVSQNPWNGFFMLRNAWVK